MISHLISAMSYSISDVDWIYSTLELGICNSTFKLNDCVIYCRVRPYTVCRQTTPGGRRLAINAHRVALMKKVRTVDVPSCIQASHLCHRPGCINLDHINPEDQGTNEARKLCYENKICSGHGDHPACILYPSH